MVLSPNDDMLTLLTAQGFSEPQKWLPYATRHRLRSVPAEHLLCCPNCGHEHRRPIAQYVYYSHLTHLQHCRQCSLIYADVRLDPSIIKDHFERTYKDDGYFLQQRRAVFQQLAHWIATCAPLKGRVLDVGGATGALMMEVFSIRPDLHMTLSDLSSTACQEAEGKGFAVICGGIAELATLPHPFDVVVMSDVIYYEPDIRTLWQILPGLVAKGGTLILRVPNKLFFIRLGQTLLRLTPGRTRMADQVPFFNPEHAYIFSRTFLVQQLKQLGFTPRCFPARALRKGGWKKTAAELLDLSAWSAATLSGERLIISPSLLIVAEHTG
jgi:2-polyprenyl-3-methyl-5-hydroxy-6-metoxy-1,4-benzoquinol methylase